MNSPSLKNSAKTSSTGFSMINKAGKKKKPTSSQADLPSQRSTKTPQKLNDIQPCSDHDKIFPQTAQSSQRPRDQIQQFVRPQSTKESNPHSFQRYFQVKEKNYEGQSRLKTANSRSLSKDNRGDTSKDRASARNNYSFKANNSRNTSPNKYGLSGTSQQNYSSLSKTESVRAPTLLYSKYASERVGLHKSTQSNTSSLSKNLQMSRSHSRTPEKLDKSTEKTYYSTNNSSRSQIKQIGNSQRASQNYSSSNIMKKEERLEEETPKPRMFKAPINTNKQLPYTPSVTPPKLEDCQVQAQNGIQNYQTTPELSNKYQSEKKKTLSPTHQALQQKRKASPSKLNSMVTKAKRNQVFPGQPTTQKIQKPKQQIQKPQREKEELAVTYHSLQVNGKKSHDLPYQPLKKGFNYYQTALVHFNQPSNKRAQMLEYKQVYKPDDFYHYIKEIYEEHYTQNFYSLRYCKSIPQRVFHDYKTKIIYLPQIQDPRIKRTIVFDLDETLIHCNDSNEDPCDFKVDIDFPDNETIQACINVRPFCKEILESLQEYFELVVFTASHQCYAESVLANIDPDKKIFQHRFYRDNCIQAGDGLYIKDLRVIGNRTLKDILIVDNAAYSFSQQLDNGIPIIPFYEHKSDRELLYLRDYLLELNKESDWVSTNKSTFNFGLYQESENQDQCLKKLMELENWK